MKKFMFAFASLALMTAVHAADGTETKFNGELRARFFSNMNPTLQPDTTANAAKQESHWEQRTKLGVTFSKGENLSGHIGLIAANTWGNDYGTITQAGTLSSASSENFMVVHEAWGYWKAFSNFSLRIGRGAMQVADGTVMSTNDWVQLPYAFDGVLGTWYSEFANFNIFGVKAFDTYAFEAQGSTAAVAGLDSPESNFYGVSMDVKNLPEALKMVNVHVLQSNAFFPNNSPTGLFNMNSLRYGVTLAGSYMNIDYRGTYAANNGQQNQLAGTSITTTGSMFDIGAGYTFVDFMNAHVGVLFHSDTGDDSTTLTKNEGYDTFYYDKHGNAGLMDIVKWGNATYFKVGASLEPMEMTKVGVDYFSFTRSTNKGFATFWTTGLDQNQTAGLNQNDSAVGSEIDVYVNKSYDNGLSMNVFYGIFTPGDYLNKPNGTALATSLKPVNEFAVEAKMVF